MGVLKQLGLLLQRYLIIRKRQPVILLLEVLWPVLIFVIVAVVRQGAPPTQKPNCHYAERAQPDAGLLPFIQTYACNLDNQCMAKDEEYAVASRVERLSSMLEELAPHLSNPNVIGALSTLNNVSGILDNLDKSIKNKTWLMDYIENGVPIRELFRDPDQLRETILRKQFIEPDVFDTIMNSTLNLNGIVSRVGNFDLEKTICDPAELKHFLLARDGAVVNISESLCSINSSDINGIIRVFQDHLDIANIVKMLGQSFSDYNLKNAFDDIAYLLDLILNTPAVKAMIENLPELFQLKDIIVKIPKWIKGLENYKEDGSIVLKDIVSALDPVIDGLAPNNPVWASVKQAVTYLDGFLSLILGSPEKYVEFKNFFSNLPGVKDLLRNTGLSNEQISSIMETKLPLNKLTNGMGSLTDKYILVNTVCSSKVLPKGNLLKEYLSFLCDDRDIPLAQEFMNFVNLTQLTQMAYEASIENIAPVLTGIDEVLKAFSQLTDIPPDFLGIFQALSSIHLKETVDTIEKMITGQLEPEEAIRTLSYYLTDLETTLSKLPIAQETGIVVTVIDGTLSTAQQVMNTLKDITGYFRGLFQNDSSSVKALDELLGLGPQIMSAFLKAMTDPKTAMSLIQHSENISAVFCDDDNLSEFLSLPKTSLSTSMQTVFCNSNITQITRDIIKLLNLPEFEEIFRSGLSDLEWYVMEGNNNTVNSFNFSNTIWKGVTLYGSIVDFMNTAWHWNSTDYAMEIKNYQIWPMVWQPVIPDTYITGFGVIMERWGPVLEESKFWPDVGRYFKIVELMMQSSLQSMQTVDIILSDDTSIGRLLTYYIQYAPEMIDGFISLIDSPRMLNELMNSNDIRETLCDPVKVRGMMNIPSYVPLEQIVETVCTIDYRHVLLQMATKLSNMNSVDTIYQEIHELMTSNKSVVEMDWVKMMSDMRALISGQSTTNGKLNQLLMNLNWTHLATSVNNLIYQTEHFSYDHFARLFGLGLGFLAEIDGQFTSEPIWRIIKHYLQMMNAYLDNFERTGYSVRVEELFPNATTIHNLVNQMYAVVPDLIEALQNTIVHPFEIGIKLLKQENWRLCSEGYTVTSLLEVKNPTRLRQLENSLCTIDLQQIATELGENTQDQGFQDALISYMSPNKTVADISLDWPKLITSVSRYFDTLKTFDWESLANLNTIGLDMTAINKQLNQLIYTFNTSLMDPNIGVKLSAQVFPLMDLLSTTDSSLAMSWRVQKTYYHIINQLLNVANKNLPRLQGEKEVNILDFFNSEELNKIAEVLKASPDIVDILLDLLLDISMSSERAAKLTNPAELMHVCSDRQAFEDFFPEVARSELDIPATICNVTLVNATKLLLEVENSLPGLSLMIQSVTQMVHGNYSEEEIPLNVTSYVRNFEEFSAILTDLLTSPPSLNLGLGTRWMNATVWENILSQYGGRFEALMKRYESFGMDDIINMILANLKQQFASMTVDEHFNEAMAILGHSAQQTYTAMQQLLARNTSDVRVFLVDYPTLERIIELSDKLPQILATVIYTNNYNPLALTSLIGAATSWEKFCSLDISFYIQDVPGLNFNMTSFTSDLCDLNMTMLTDEVEAFLGVTDLMSTNPIGYVPSMDPAVNIARMNQAFDDMARVFKLYFQVFSNPPLPLQDVFNWLNGTLWRQTFDTLGKGLADPASVLRIYENLDKMLPQLVNLSQMDDFTSEMWKIQKYEVYIINELLVLANKNLPRLQGKVDILDFFQSPELEKIAMAVKASPELVKLIFDTFLDLMENPYKSAQFSDPVKWMRICEEPSTFNEFFPESLTSNVDIQEVVCNLTLINTTELVSELENGVYGLSQLIQSMNRAFRPGATVDDINVSYLSMAKNSEMFTNLLINLTTSPPMISLGEGQNWTNPETWSSLWTTFDKGFMNISQSTLSMGVDEVLKNLAPSLEPQFQALYQTPGFNMSLALLQMALKTNLQLMEIKKANSSANLYEMVSGFPEVEKIFRMVNKLPYLITSAFQPETLVRIEEMVREFSKLASLEEFCALDLTSLFPGLSNTKGLSPEGVKQEFCAINWTEAVKQVDSFFNMPTLYRYSHTEEFRSPDNTSFSVSVTTGFNANVTITEVIESVVELSVKLPASLRDDFFPGISLLNEAEWSFWWKKMSEEYDLTSAQKLLDLVSSMRGSMVALLNQGQIPPAMLASLDGVTKYLTSVVQMIQAGKLPDTMLGLNQLPFIATLEKLADQAPDIVDVFLETLFHPNNSQQLMLVLAKPEVFCNLTELQTRFLFVIPENSTVNISEVQQLICSINITEFISQMADPNVVASINPLLSSFSPQGNVKPIDVNQFVDNILFFEKSLVNVTFNPPTQFQQLNIEDLFPSIKLFLPETWKSLYDKLSAKVMANPASLFDVLLSLRTAFGEMLKNPASRDSALSIMMSIDEVLTYLTDMFQQLQGGKISDPFSNFALGKNIQGILSMLEQAPYLVEILVETMLDPVKSQSLLMYISPQDALGSFCNISDLSTVFEQPQGSPVNLSAVQQTICGIDPIQLAYELETLSQWDFSNLITLLTPSVQVTYNMTEMQIFTFTEAFFEHVQDFQSAFNNLTTNPPDFSNFNLDDLMSSIPLAQLFDANIWSQMITRVENRLVSRDPFSFGEQLLPLIRLLPTSGPEMKILHIVTVVMETFMDKIEELGNKSTINLADFFPSSPNLKKLAEFIDSSPEAVEILLYSANTQQFMTLFTMPTIEDGLREVCTNPENYFTYPGSADQLRTLITEFCHINLTVMITEFYQELRIPEMSSNMTFDIGAYINATTRLSGLISKWITSPPPLLTINSQWTNETYWFNTLAAYAQSLQGGTSGNMTVPVTIVKQILDSILQSLPRDVQSVQAALVVFEEVSRLVKDKLNELAGGTLSLNTLLSDAPRVKQLLQDSLNIAPDLVETMFSATINNIDTLEKLVTSENWRSMICDRPGALKDLFNIPANVNSTEVQSLVCSINETLLSEDFIQLLGINTISGKIEQLLRNNYTINWQEFLQETDGMYKAIDNIIRNPPSVNLPVIDVAALEKIAQSFIQGDQVMGLSNLIKVYNILDKYLQGTEGWETVSAYYKASQYFMEYANDLLGRIQVNNHKIDLATLFGDSSRVRHILDMAFNLGPDFVNGFLSASVNPAKINDLTSGGIDLERLFCTEAELREYFTFHPSFNLSYAVQALCGIAGRNIINELKQSLDIGILENRLKNIDNSSVRFDPVQYIGETQQFSLILARLINSSGVTFGGKDVANYLFKVDNNVTNLLQNFLTISMSPKHADYVSYLQLLNPVLERTDFWKTLKPALNAVNIMTDVITQKLTVLETEPITLENILQNATYFRESMKKLFGLSPEIVEAISHAQSDIQKMLSEIPEYPDLPDFSNFTDEQWLTYEFPTFPPLPNITCMLHYIKLPASVNSTVKDYLCNLRTDVWLAELKKQINYDKILAVFMEAGQNNSKPFDWRTFLYNVQTLQEKLNMLPNIHLNVGSFPEFLAQFFSYHGDIEDWLKRVENAAYYSPTQHTMDILGFVKFYGESVLSSVKLGVDMSKENPALSGVMSAFGRLLSLLNSELMAISKVDSLDIRTLLKFKVVDAKSLLGVDSTLADQFLSIRFKTGVLLNLQSMDSHQMLCGNSSSLNQVFDLPEVMNSDLNDLLQTVFCNMSSPAYDPVYNAVNLFDPHEYALNMLLEVLHNPDMGDFNASTATQEAINLLDMIFVRPSQWGTHKLSPALQKLLIILQGQIPTVNAKLYSLFVNTFLSFFDRNSVVYSDWTRVGEAFQVVISYASSFMFSYLGVPVTLSDLFRDDVSLFNLLPLQYARTTEFNNILYRTDVDLKQLSPLFSRPNGADELCEETMFYKVFMVDADIFDRGITREDFYQVLCNDSSALLQGLRNELDLNVSDLFAKLTDLISGRGSNPHVDWEGLYTKADSFIKTIVGMGSLSLDNIFQRLIQYWVGPGDYQTLLHKITTGDPQTLSNLLASVGQALSPLDTNRYLYPLFQYIDGPVLQSVTSQMRLYREIFSSNTTDVISSILNFDQVAKNQLEALDGVDIIESMYCDVNKVASLLGVTKAPYNASAVSMVMCQQPANTWYNSLVNLGMNSIDIMTLTSMLEGEMLTKFASQPRSNPPLSSLDWTQFGNRLQNYLTELGIHQETAHWDQQKIIQEIGTGSLQALASTLDVLRFIDPLIKTDWWDTGKKYVQLFSEVLKMSNIVLDELTVTNSTLMMSNLFPNPEQALDLLESVLDPRSSSELLTAVIYPNKLLDLVVADDLHNTVCDPEKFDQTFMYNAAINSTQLQKALCAASKDNATVLHEFLKMMDVRSLLEEIQRAQANYEMEKVMPGSSLWSYAKAQVQQFSENMKKLGMVKMLDPNWWKDANNTFNGGLIIHIDKFEKGCEAILPLFSGEFHRTLDQILNLLMSIWSSASQQIELTIDFDKIVCDLPGKRLPEIVRSLADINVFKWIKSLMEPTPPKFECRDFSLMTQSIIMDITKLPEIYGRPNNTTPMCLRDLFKSVAVTDLDFLFRLMGDTLTVLQDKDIVGLYKFLQPPFDQFIPYVEVFLRAFLGQQKVFSSLSNLLTNVTEARQYFTEILSYSPAIVENLFNSTLNLDIVRLFNNSADVVKDIFCDSDQLSQYLSIPEGIDITLQDLSDTLCIGNITEAVTYVQTALNLGRITILLSQAGNTNTDLSWLESLSTHISSLFTKIVNIADLSKFDLNNVNIDEILPEIQSILSHSGPQSIIDNVVAIINDFRGATNNEDATKVINTLVTVTQGLNGLNLLKRYIIPNIEQMLVDADAVRTYMREDLKFSPQVIEAIMKSTVTMKLNNFLKNLTAVVCVPYRLADVLYLDENYNSGVSVADISQALCQLDTNTLADLTQILFRQADVSDLIDKLVELTAEDFLSAGTDIKDVENIFNELKRAQDDFAEASAKFTNISQEFDLNILIATPERLTSEATEASQFLCGKTPQLTDEFQLVNDDPADTTTTAPSSSDDQPTKTVQKKFSESEMEEINSMPTPFCRDLLRDVYRSAGSEAGILWAYLKPLIMGKILFTPDTPLTRQIIQQANSTFSMLSEVNELAHKWAKGSLELKSFVTTVDRLDNIVDLLSSPVVSNLIQSMVGVSGASLSENLEQLSQLSVKDLDQLHFLAALLANYTDCISADRWQSFDTSDKVASQAEKLVKAHEMLAAVEFLNVGEDPNRKRRDTGTTDLSKNVIYKIRMDIDNVLPTGFLKGFVWRPVPDDNFAEDLRYLRGFVQLQGMLDRAIIELHTGMNGTYPNIYHKQMPFPCHEKDNFLHFLSYYILPIMMTVAWIGSLGMAIKILMYDREKGLEETLKVMGLSGGVNWVSWLLITMVFMIIVCGLEVLILNVSGILDNSNWFILFLYFIDFCLSSLMMCYMVSAFFTRANIAALTCLIIYLISYLPFVLVTALEHQLTFTEKLLTCLSSTTAFGFASQYLSRFEEQMVGVQWDNINTSPIDGDRMNMHWACIMMLVDSAIYLIIGWYVRNIIPRKYGIRQPWYFPVLPSYWGCCCTGSSASKYKHTKGATNGGFDSSDLIEMVESKEHQVGISLVNLTKTYSGNKQAVDHLSLDFYKGQITSLLGHNGAGKTTTLNMLTGVVRPTSGLAIVNDLSIYKDLNKIREDIGICPQHDILFDFMTVKEHLKFYMGLKDNFTGKSADQEIYKMLENVDMVAEKDVPVNQLSGGMKRRLCVALAFVGGAETVILDEPTSGVDPSARRGVWDVIQHNKHNRTIILSTHHLDEADVLGDRIAILHEGKLLSSGSSMFLKKQLGNGYHLRVSTHSDTSSQSDSARESDDSFTSSKLLTFIQKYIPKAEIQEEVGNEVKINLPASEEEKQIFYRMFLDLDKNLMDFGIESYGISDTTLEEVFLKVCYLADHNKPFTPENLRTWSHNNSISDQSSSRGSENDFIGLVKAKSEKKGATGLSLKFKQFAALFIKRFHHCRRDWRFIFTTIFLPLIFVATGMGFSLIEGDRVSNPPLVLTPSIYGDGQYAFLKSDPLNPVFNKMSDQMYGDPGLGTTCMADMRKWDYIKDKFQCENDLTHGYFAGDKMPDKKDFCTCKAYRYTCDGSAPRPPHNLTRTGITIQNLNHMDVEDYLLESFLDFEETRYGGWSFEDNDKARVWYNTKGYHALPSYVNSLSNAVLRSRLTENQDPQEYGITAINHPFTITTDPLNRDTVLRKSAQVGVALVILMAFSFVVASVIIYVVDEREHKEKQLQYISGVGPLTYWSVAFVWDMLVYGVTVGLAVLIIWLFKIEIYMGRQNLQAVVVLLFLFGSSCMSMMYMLNKLFTSSSTAYMTLFCLNMLLGIITTMTVFLLSFFTSVEVIRRVFEILSYIFMILPQFCLGEGLVRLTTNQLYADVYMRFGEDVYKDPFSREMLMWLMVAMAVQTVVFFIITLLTELRPRPIFRLKRPRENMLEDEDVKAERHRVLEGHANDDVVKAVNLSKLYVRGLKKVVAVDNLTFGVHRGECFGLLGVNGAGKTSTFKMLTGESMSSFGQAYINGKRVKHLDASTRKTIGYCPQTNALDDYVSGRELLMCHARLKGVSSKDAEETITALSSSLEMDAFIDKPTKTYSGGMKRKLCLAIAVQGSPDVIYLDEPTAGMDPGNRRLAWNVILDLVKGGKSVVLTSHSMSECDILCSRVAIMVNGRFVCMGSPQHLKHKFSEGYRVILKLKQVANVHSVTEFMMTSFPGTLFKDQHQNTLEFAIPSQSSNLANIFGHLERQKPLLEILDYSVQQTTLDAVFIHFAKHQTDGLTESPDGSVTETDLEMSKGSVKSKVGLSGPFVNETYAFMNPQMERGERIEMKPNGDESGFYSDNLKANVSRNSSQRSEKAKNNPLYGFSSSDDVTHL